MLVLTRKLNEVIRIGPDITVQIVQIRGDQIRLGINAPKALRISREEPDKPLSMNWPEQKPERAE